MNEVNLLMDINDDISPDKNQCIHDKIGKDLYELIDRTANTTYITPMQ